MEKSQKLIIAVVAVAAVIIVAAAAVVVMSNSDENEGTITDGLGRVVKVDSSDRIAATSAVVTEIICGIGGYSKLAAVTQDSSYQVSEYIMGIPNDGYPQSVLNGLNSGALYNMGPMYQINAEAILGANPDVVIMGGYFNNDATIAAIENMGIPVVICKDDNSIENIYFNIDLIGKVIQKETEARLLIDQMKSAIGKIVGWTASLNAAPQNVAVFMMYGSEYGTYANGNSYVMGTPMITMLGGTNAFSNISGMYEVVSTESIIAANPDIIIDSSPGTAADLDSIKTNTLTRGIKAAENDRIYGTFGTSSTAFTLTSQGFVNSVGIMAMFMYEDHLNFEMDHYMGSGYAADLQKFWNQINS